MAGQYRAGNKTEIIKTAKKSTSTLTSNVPQIDALWYGHLQSYSLPLEMRFIWSSIACLNSRLKISNKLDLMPVIIGMISMLASKRI